MPKEQQDDNTTEVVSTRITKDEWEGLERIAISEERPRSQVVRFAIREYIEANQPKRRAK
jgi:metal-responsive CopG/Arc/MetJ family transcriptional regulator